MIVSMGTSKNGRRLFCHMDCSVTPYRARIVRMRCKACGEEPDADTRQMIEEWDGTKLNELKELL